MKRWFWSKFTKRSEITGLGESTARMINRLYDHIDRTEARIMRQVLEGKRDDNKETKAGQAGQE